MTGLRTSGTSEANTWIHREKNIMNIYIYILIYNEYIYIYMIYHNISLIIIMIIIIIVIILIYNNTNIYIYNMDQVPIKKIYYRYNFIMDQLSHLSVVLIYKPIHLSI